MWPPSFSLALLGGVGTALLSVQWAYHGWTNLGPVREEVREPQRNVPHRLPNEQRRQRSVPLTLRSVP